MATAAKKQDAAPANDNMALWDAVCKTDPKHTKRVNQRGGFTAIDAQYQFMEATRQFGPIGVGWGYVAGEPILMTPMIVIPVTLWHGNRENSFGPIYGCAEMFGKHPDRDAPKKAETDAITKGLSQLGFNADVFLGRFDDNKYVEEMRKEFGGPPANDGNGHPKDAPFPQGPCKNKTELKDKGRAVWRDIEASDDPDQFDALLITSQPIIDQIKAALPSWWTGGKTGSGEDFEGMEAVISRKGDELHPDDQSWRKNPILGG